VLYLPLEGVVDLDKERARLRRSYETALREAARIDRQLNDEQFVNVRRKRWWPKLVKTRKKSDCGWFDCKKG